ncbi:hypothetical protein D3C71_1090440 [compost metagenome]
MHQVGIAAPIDKGQHPLGAHALGQQGRHDVVLVVIGQRQKEVDLFHALAAQQVFVRRIALQHQHIGRQTGRQLDTAIRVGLNHLDVKPPRLLAELARQPQPHAATPGNHDAPDRLPRAVPAPVQGREHVGNVAAGRQHKHLIARLDARVAIAGHKAVRLVLKPPVDRHQAHGHVGQALAQLADGAAHHGRPGARAHRHQAGAAARKLAHLHGLGVFDQLADVAGQGLFGADDAVHAKALGAGQPLIQRESVGTHPRDALGDVEHQLRHLATHQVGLVLCSAGDQQIGVLGARLGQHGRFDAIAHHTAQVKARLQVAQAGCIGVDDCDVVALGHQAVCHALAHTARAEDDDFHKKLGLSALQASASSYEIRSKSTPHLTLAQHHVLE